MRCGTKTYNNTTIPVNAVIKISPLGREYYVSGIFEDYCLIRFVDGDCEFMKLKKTPL